MGDLSLFEFEGKQLRVIALDGQPWFVAKDVCDSLGIGNVSLAVNGRERKREDGTTYWSGGLDDDEKGVVTVNTPGGDQELLGVSESGLYNLVFQSTKPEAKEFKRWVTHEVIPSIRKTGAYAMPQQPVALEDLIILQAQSVKDLKVKVAEIEARTIKSEETVAAISETLLKRDPDWRKMVNSLLNGCAYRSGGDYSETRNDSYRILEDRGRCDLAKRLRNLVKRLEESGATKTQLNSANRLDVIEDDARLKEIYTNICKELSIGSLQLVR